MADFDVQVTQQPNLYDLEVIGGGPPGAPGGPGPPGPPGQEGIGWQTVVTQPGHGFGVPQIVGFNGTSWFLALADNANDAEVIGIVQQVIDANNFVIQTGGFVSGLSALLPGVTYFLSDATAGRLTPTPPAAYGHVSKPLLVAYSATSGWFFNWRGMMVEPAATSGFSGFSGYSGAQGTSGFSGFSSSVAGASGISGFSGFSGVATSASYWNYRVDLGTGPNPPSGEVRWDNATQINAANLYFDGITNDGIDTGAFITRIAPPDQIGIQDKGNSANFQNWNVTGNTITTSPGNFQIPVALINSGGTGTTNFANNLPVIAVVQRIGASGASGFSGFSGFSSSVAGPQGTSGFSGFSSSVAGPTGPAGTSGFSGYSGAGGGGGTPGGSDTQVQYNSAGAFAGSANLIFTGTSLGVTGVINISRGATNNGVWNSLVTGDASPRINIQAGGLINLGSGSAALDTGIYRNAAGVVEINSGATGTYREIIVRSVIHSGVTVATLPSGPTAGQVAYVTDGTAALAWGATVTGGGSTKYLVWYNGAAWTVAGK